MAVEKYIATAKGYVDGRVIEEGEAFVTDFREVVRDTNALPLQKARLRRDGTETSPAIYPIKRDPKTGEAVTKDAKPPSWARLTNEAEYIASMAADNTFEDVNFDAMDDAALQAYAAERQIPFDKKTSRKDLITAIQAAVSYAT